MDPREHGSRNIGFSNVLRIAGWMPGILTLAGDMGKGCLAVIIAKEGTAGNEFALLIAGFMAVLGHNHSIFLKLKGGKGVATGYGVLLGISPSVAIVLLVVWAVVIAIWRLSSLGAIVSFTMLPPVMWWFEGEMGYLLFSLILSLTILVRHHENMLRLWKGTEQRLRRP